jgi:hypothetical protein
LLSETAPGGANNNARILASLEGRVVAQQPVRRRSKKPLVAVALAVLGLGAFGAWQWQRSQVQVSEHPELTQSAASDTTHAATGASAAAATRVAQGEAASAPQPAVIVADDSVSGNPAAASAPADSDAGRLSRALASGTTTGQSAAQVAQQPASATGATAAHPASGVASTALAAASAAPAAPVSKRAQAKALASRTQHESAKTRRAEKLAAAHARKRAKARAAAAKDDPDADLLAALIARTKPYDAKAPHGASDVSAKGASSAKGRTVSLGDQIKACDKGNFLEAQSCRWHVCSGHWGKDPACPGSAPAAQAH